MGKKRAWSEDERPRRHGGGRAESEKPPPERDRRGRDRERDADEGRDGRERGSSRGYEGRERRGRDREREKERRGGRGEENVDRYMHRGRENQGEEEEGRSLKDGVRKPVEERKPWNANSTVDVASLGKTEGVYIPPFKLARMMKEVEDDKSSPEYQRLTWDALRKSINGFVNKVNATNIKNIIPELFSENLIRGRGLFCRTCMKSQMASPRFTDVFAALVAVINTKFQEVGLLLLKRVVLQLKRAYKRSDKQQLLAAVKFIAHLVNQQVAPEIVALELLAVLLDKPTDDSVEVAVGFVTECGSLLQDVSPRGLDGAFERFRVILHEGEINKRVQFLIEGLFAIRKAKFQGYPAARPELDLVEQDDRLIHKISLQGEIDPETKQDSDAPEGCRYLPEDIIRRIFLRLPLASVVRLRFLNKGIGHLVSSDKFKSDYVEGNSPSEKHLLILRREWYDPERCFQTLCRRGSIPPRGLDVSPPCRGYNRVKIVGHCQGVLGLFCNLDFSCRSRRENLYDVMMWNPSIRRSVVIPALPNLVLGTSSVQLGFGSVGWEYKFIVIPRHSSKAYVCSSMTRNWTTIHHPPLEQLRVCEECSTLVNQACHWAVWDVDAGAYSMLRFSLHKEEFSKMGVPNYLGPADVSQVTNPYSISTIVHGGCLSLVANMSYEVGPIVIWAMREYGEVNSWTRMQTIADLNWGLVQVMVGFTEGGDAVFSQLG